MSLKRILLIYKVLGRIYIKTRHFYLLFFFIFIKFVPETNVLITRLY